MGGPSRLCDVVLSSATAWAVPLFGGGGQGIFEVLAKRWTPQILFLLLQRPARFSELERAVPGLTNRVMADRLRELQDAGLVDRQVEPGPPITSIYTLTADGEALRPILEGLRPWADRRARKRLA